MGDCMVGYKLQSISQTKAKKYPLLEEASLQRDLFVQPTLTHSPLSLAHAYHHILTNFISTFLTMILIVLSCLAANMHACWSLNKQTQIIKISMIRVEFYLHGVDYYLNH